MRRALAIAATLLLLLGLLVPSAAGAEGNYRVGVFLVNWLDDPDQIVAPETVYDQMFTADRSVVAYYADTSYGQVAMYGDVLGWFTVNYNKSAGCAASLWARDVREQATAQGIDWAAYDARVYMWRTGAGCGWSGFSSGNDNYINVLGAGGIHEPIISHELGHTLGVGHANTYICQDKDGIQIQISLNRGDSCSIRTYADAYDVMGNSSFYTMNAIHRTMRGWLPPENTQTVTSAGTFTILPLEWSSSGVQHLEVVPPKHGHLQPWNLCLEVRQSYGWDQFNETYPNGNRWAVEGVHIHLSPSCRTGGWTERGSTALLDATPNSPNEPSGSPRFNYPLPVSQDFTGQGVRIRTLSIGPDGATVQVTYPKGNQ